MREIRFHGRGGQGAVVASEMLAAMYFEMGEYVQAFPAFGVERRGAPVLAFTRVDYKPIEIHYGIYEPDHVIVLDQTIIELINVAGGLKKDGFILINSEKSVKEFPQFDAFEVFTVDVNSIARRHKLGIAALPIVNTAILGAYTAASGALPIEKVRDVILRLAPSKNEENAAAAVEAYNSISKV